MSPKCSDCQFYAPEKYGDTVFNEVCGTIREFDKCAKSGKYIWYSWGMNRLVARGGSEGCGEEGKHFARIKDRVRIRNSRLWWKEYMKRDEGDTTTEFIIDDHPDVTVTLTAGCFTRGCAKLVDLHLKRAEDQRQRNVVTNYLRQRN